MQGTDTLAHKLASILDPLQDKIKDMQCRVVPSAFNSSDPYLRAFPIARDWRWSSAAEHLLAFKPQTLILQLPSFWQLEPFAHAASRAAEAPVCNIEPQNFPLDKAAIRLASADAILAEASEAGAIADYLTAQQIELPPYWILVYAGDAPSWDLATALTNKEVAVAREVHLVPGVPLLVQCKDIVAAKNGYYHQSDLFTWNDTLSAPAISTTDSLLFTLKDFTLPFALADNGACACGKRLLTRVY